MVLKIKSKQTLEHSCQSQETSYRLVGSHVVRHFLRYIFVVCLAKISVWWKGFPN